MAVIRVSIALDPATLLDRAVEGLFPLARATPEAPWPTLGAWLVLRQGGLRDDVHRLAAAAHVAGWFDPPVCLFAELAARWGVDGARSLSDEQRIALLTAVVSRHADDVFDRSGSADAWVPAIDRLIGELRGEGITPEAFAEALQSRTNRDEFERLRDTRLASIYSDWVFTVNANFRDDGRDGLVRLARFIRTQPDEFQAVLGGRRDVRIVGLADLRGGWRALLSALSDCSHVDVVTIHASHALPLPSSLAASVIADDTAPTLASALFTPVGDALSAFEEAAPASARAPTVRLLEAPDATREIEHVAVRVRSLLDSGACAPHRIAIAVRQARPGVDRMADALETLDVPVTARRRAALSQSGPAKAIRALLNAAVEGFTRHAIVEMAEHPLLPLTLDPNVLQAAGQSAPITSLDAWTPALQQLLARCRQRDLTPDDWRTHRGLPDTTQASETLDAWRAWEPEARRLTNRRTDSEWFAWVHEILTSERWGIATFLREPPANDRRVWRADCRAHEQIIALAKSWTAALRELQVQEVPRDADQFARRLALVLDADVVTQPETGFGVVVAEALAIGWRAFDHVFVVGLASGEFPRRPPPSSLLPESDRRALSAAGLPIDPPDSWRVREQELFRVLCAAPRESLTLSWPSMDSEGREVARSVFVDEVMDLTMRARDVRGEEALETAEVLTRVPTQLVRTPAFPIVARDQRQALDHALRVAAIEGARSRALSSHNGRVDDAALLADFSARFGESYNWSATQLEELGKCGWSWMASRLLKLEERGDLEDGMEPTTRGTLLHDALHRFFEAAIAHKGGAAFLLSADREWVAPALVSAFDAAWEALVGRAWLGTPALHELTRAELFVQLQRYVDFEIGRNDDSFEPKMGAARQIRTGAIAGELEFSELPLAANGVRFLLRGMIDRVDIGVDERIAGAERYVAAIDYKSSKGSTPAGGSSRGWDDGIVLQVPLYALALRSMRIDGALRTLARLEYRTLKRPSIVHSLEFVKLKTVGKAKQAVDAPEALAKLDAALAHAARHVRNARGGTLAADPTRSAGCSPYCVARDICRIPGGPVEAAT